MGQEHYALMANISAKHREILNRIKNSHGFSIREMVEMGIDHLGQTFRSELPSEDSISEPILPATQKVITSFAKWIQECQISPPEVDGLLYCVNNAPTIKGRFVTQLIHGISGQEILVSLKDDPRSILRLFSLKGVEAFRVHLTNQVGIQQLQINLSPQEDARVEHSLSELISDTRGTQPMKPAVLMGSEFV
jgi:hypothetical protein